MTDQEVLRKALNEIDGFVADGSGEAMALSLSWRSSPGFNCGKQAKVR